MIATDTRFSAPLYTSAEVAAFVGVSRSTVHRWTRGAPDEAPLLTEAEAAGVRGHASLTFATLAEAHVLTAFKQAGVSTRKVREALGVLRAEKALEHALAHRELRTDGVEVLREITDPDDPESQQLFVIRDGQRVLRPAIEQYLTLIDYAEDGYAERLRLPIFTQATVIVDPRVSFGQPVLASSGVRVETLVDMWFAGQSIEATAHEYGLQPSEVEAAIRPLTQRAA